MTTLKQYSNNTQRRLISVEKNAGADLLVFVESKFKDNECFDFANMSDEEKFRFPKKLFSVGTKPYIIMYQYKRKKQTLIVLKLKQIVVIIISSSSSSSSSNCC